MTKDRKPRRSPRPKSSPPEPTPSGISDIKVGPKGKVSAFDVPKSPFYDDDVSDFTPITNLNDLGPAIGDIKRGQDRTAGAVEGLERTIREEVKPKLDTVTERTVNQEARIKASEARLRRLETDSREIAVGVAVHDCDHEEDFRDIADSGRQVLGEIGSIAARVSVVESNAKASKERQKEEIEKTDKRWSRFTAALITIGIAALAGIIGWVVTLTTVRSDVGHLSREQTKLREAVKNVPRSVSKDARRVEAAATRVENAASAPAVIIEPADPLEELWCDLSDHEKSRQKRIRDGKIPTKRCP